MQSLRMQPTHATPHAAAESPVSMPVVHALVEAGATQRGIPMSGGTREGWRSSDAMCEAAIAVVATIFEGIKLAGDGPLVALSV